MGKGCPAGLVEACQREARPGVLGQNARRRGRWRERIPNLGGLAAFSTHAPLPGSGINPRQCRLLLVL